jgi:serine/threonine-protein kinase
MANEQTIARSCSACGGPVPANAPQGLCPRCLFQLGSDLPFHGARGAAFLSNPKVGRADRRFGDYELVEEIARGGMGVVWRARQVSLNRMVALKLIAAGELASTEAVRRFKAEAEAAASLDHPNILPIYEVGECDGQHFFSMKLVEGRSLAERLSSLEFQIPNQEAAALLAKVARAVHYAHQHGILHRDLKPGNILLDAAGEPHVTDFGLAKRVESAAGLTLSGAVLGTPAYMAPEQAGGGTKRLTTAADIYSLGVILYEMLAGQPPFRGDTPLDVMRKVVEEEPLPPSRVKSEIRSSQSERTPTPKARSPAAGERSFGFSEFGFLSGFGFRPSDLDIICLKCLEKDPPRRYTSAEALAQDLERWLRHEPILARPSRPAQRVLKWARRKPALATMAVALQVVALTGLAGILWQWRQAVVARNVARLAQGTAEETARELRQTLARARVAEGWRRFEDGDAFAALAPFAEALQLEEDDPARAAVHRMRLASVFKQCPRLVKVWSVGGRLHYAQLSANGTKLVTGIERGTNYGAAQVWDVATGRALTPPMVHADAVTFVEFSPDGRRVVTASYDGTARVWDALTGQPLTPPLPHENGVAQARFSPDGQRVVTGDLRTLGSQRAHQPQRAHPDQHAGGVECRDRRRDLEPPP